MGHKEDRKADLLLNTFVKVPITLFSGNFIQKQIKTECGKKEFLVSKPKIVDTYVISGGFMTIFRNG